jgi:hypothetical protein
MPPRWVVAAVVAGWLAALGWLAHDAWLPWLRPADEPAFVVEVADEVAPEHFSWTLSRNGQRVGSAETRLAPRKDGRFELTTRLRDLEVGYGKVARFKFQAFAITRLVTPAGDQLTLDGKGVVQVTVQGHEAKIEAAVRRRVEGDQSVGEAEFDHAGSVTRTALEPVRLVSRNVVIPLQPGQKYPPLRPGQTWRATHVDPLFEAMAGALRVAVSDRLPGALPDGLGAPRPPAVLLAQVQTDTEEVGGRDRVHTCRVIVFEGDGVRVRTWVDVADGRIVRQEAGYHGETIVLQRE